jgi:zinc protease
MLHRASPPDTVPPMRALSLVRLILPLTLLLPTPLLAQQAMAPATATLGSTPPLDPATAAAWRLTDSDLPRDPAVRIGVLPNGFRYILRHNETPRAQVLVRLRVAVGSLAERDDERGFAHFVEHMAFAGSTNVPDGTMVPLLEREGLAFGADTNASTNFEETTYRLDLPTARTLDTALMLMRDVAGELTFPEAAVLRERGVILAERRTRDNFSLDNIRDRLAFSYAGTIVPDRLPIGDAAVVGGATAPALRAFYDRWYRPEVMTLVIAGDFDVDATERAIRDRFTNLAARGERAAPPVIRIDPARPLSADNYTSAAIGDAVGLIFMQPWQPQPDTRAARWAETLRNFGTAIVNRRLQRIVEPGDQPATAAQFGINTDFDAVRTFGIGAGVRLHDWSGGLALVEREVRRARAFGFTEAEVAEQLANARRGVANDVAQAASRPTGELANLMVRFASDGSAMTLPSWRAQLFSQFAPAITAATVSQAFAAQFAGVGEPLIRVTMERNAPSPEAIIAAYRASTAVAVTPPEARAAASFAYGDLGPPGRVVSDDRIADLNIRRVRFANGVMLNLLRRTEENGIARMRVEVDGGLLSTPIDNARGLILANLLPSGGLAAHSVDELTGIIAGHNVALSFDSTNDRFALASRTTPDDLQFQAELFAALLLYPGYRVEALERYRANLPRIFAGFDVTPEGVVSRDIDAIITDGDARLVTPTEPQVRALTWEDFSRIASDGMQHGAIEIGIVGDIDEDATIAAMAASFGTLRDRRATFDPRTATRVRRFASNRQTRTLYHRGPADRAQVRFYWQARDDSDLADAIALDLLGDLFKLQLTDELRVRMGRSYTPAAGATLSRDFPGFGYLWASSETSPDDAPTVTAAMVATAARLRQSPVDAATFARVIAPFRETALLTRRDNGYWLGYVTAATSRVDRLDRARQVMAAIDAVTPARLQALAATYLTDERRLLVQVMPAAPAAAAPAPVSPSPGTRR